MCCCIPATRSWCRSRRALQKRWLATIALLLLPAAAGAEQFDYGVKSQAGWTNNVYGTSEDATILSNGQTEDLDPVDDYSMRVSPWGKVSDVDGDLTWSIQYQPSYEYYLHESDISDFDHEAGADLQWRIGDRTTLIATEAYRQFHSLVRFNENAGSLTDPAVLRGRRDELTGNRTGLALRHLLTARDERLPERELQPPGLRAVSRPDELDRRLRLSAHAEPAHDSRPPGSLGSAELLPPRRQRRRHRLLQPRCHARLSVLADAALRGLPRPGPDRLGHGAGQLLPAVRGCARTPRPRRGRARRGRLSAAERHASAPAGSGRRQLQPAHLVGRLRRLRPERQRLVERRAPAARLPAGRPVGARLDDQPDRQADRVRQTLRARFERHPRPGGRLGLREARGHILRPDGTHQGLGTLARGAQLRTLQ